MHCRILLAAALCGLWSCVPQAIENDNKDGGVLSSDASGSDASASDAGSAADVAVTSDATRPDGARPDTTVPDAARPDTALPDTALPDTSLPDTAPWCGDGDCNGGEDCASCATDCDPCPQLQCLAQCRNGSEACDDEAFSVPDPYVPMYLVCISDAGGILYVATNTGPPCCGDGHTRCQGWEEQGLNAWDYLQYVESVECTSTDIVVEVDLSAYAGQNMWMGTHEHPNGGGRMTDGCIATY